MKGMATLLWLKIFIMYYSLLPLLYFVDLHNTCNTCNHNRKTPSKYKVFNKPKTTNLAKQIILQSSR